MGKVPPIQSFDIIPRMPLCVLIRLPRVTNGILAASHVPVAGAGEESGKSCFGSVSMPAR
jgi:hypothetical protein